MFILLLKQSQLTYSSVAVLSPKVEELFKEWKYCPYTALTPTARKTVARNEDEFSAVTTSSGGFALRAKTVDRKNELYISSTDWQAAAQLAVEKIRQYWGVERALNLEKHHKIVTKLAASYSHEVAMDYDVRQREMLYGDPSHDISSTDTECLALCVWEGNRHSSSSNTGGSAWQRKRTNEDNSDDTGFHRKKQRFTSTGHCFRCGHSGHLPAACKNDTTIAGKPSASLVGGNSPFKHNLRGPNGKDYCFRFSSISKCAGPNPCQRFHGCSICHAKNHGANHCFHASSQSADGSGNAAGASA